MIAESSFRKVDVQIHDDICGKHQDPHASIRPWNVRFVQALDDSQKSRFAGNQLLSCGTFVGANYGAACRARSPAEFSAKLGVVEEECDEALYWLELCVDVGLLSEQRLSELISEANELLAVVVSSINMSMSSS